MAIKRLKGRYAHLAARKGAKAPKKRNNLPGIIGKKKLPPAYNAVNASHLPAEHLYQGKYVVDRNMYAQRVLPSYQEARLRGVSYESWLNNILPEHLRSVRKEIEIHAHGYTEPKASVSNGTIVPMDIVSRTVPTVQIKHPVAKREPVQNTRVPPRVIAHQPPNPYMAGSVEINTDNIKEALTPVPKVERIMPNNLDNSEPVGLIAPQPGGTIPVSGQPVSRSASVATNAGIYQASPVQSSPVQVQVPVKVEKPQLVQDTIAMFEGDSQMSPVLHQSEGNISPILALPPSKNPQMTLVPYSMKGGKGKKKKVKSEVEQKLETYKGKLMEGLISDVEKMSL